MPELDSHYMFAEALGRSPGAKTERWSIYSSSSEVRLGGVRWHGPWRGYVFEPDAHTIFNPGCMDSLSAFCRDATREHRERSK